MKSSFRLARVIPSYLQNAVNYATGYWLPTVHLGRRRNTVYNVTVSTPRWRGPICIRLFLSPSTICLWYINWRCDEHKSSYLYYCVELFTYAFVVCVSRSTFSMSGEGDNRAYGSCGCKMYISYLTRGQHRNVWKMAGSEPRDATRMWDNHFPWHLQCIDSLERRTIGAIRNTQVDERNCPCLKTAAGGP